MFLTFWQGGFTLFSDGPNSLILRWNEFSGTTVEDEAAGDPRLERLGFLAADFELAFGGGRLLLLAQRCAILGDDFGADGFKALFGQVAAELAVGHADIF